MSKVLENYFNDNPEEFKKICDQELLREMEEFDKVPLLQMDIGEINAETFDRDAFMKTWMSAGIQIMDAPPPIHCRVDLDFPLDIHLSIIESQYEHKVADCFVRMSIEEAKFRIREEGVYWRMIKQFMLWDMSYHVKEVL